MILKGQKIKAIKNMYGGIINEGEIFVITDITNDGAILFEDVDGVTVGALSFRELAEGFEAYVPPKYIWSDWKDKTFLYYSDDDLELIPYTYRTNGRRVQMRVFYRGDTITTQATCHRDDTFDLNNGLMLCKNRMIAKMTAIDAEKFASLL